MGKRSSAMNCLQKTRSTLHPAVLLVATCIATFAGIAIYNPNLAEAIQLRISTPSTAKLLNHDDSVLTTRDKSDEIRLETEVLSAEAISRIPESAGKTEFLAHLSQLAAATGLNIHKLLPGDEVDRKTHRKLPIYLTGETSYDSLCHFLAGLEKADRLTQLTALQVDAGNGESDTFPVTMTVTIFFALSSQTEDRGIRTDSPTESVADR